MGFTRNGGGGGNGGKQEAATHAVNVSAFPKSLESRVFVVLFVF